MPNDKRENWGKDHEILPQLDLIKLQIDSYEWFLKEGIAESLVEVNGDKGIEDFTGKNWVLSFANHRLGKSKYDLAQAKHKSVSYDMPLNTIYYKGTYWGHSWNISQKYFLYLFFT